MARILVIEDEHPLRRIIALNLAKRGYMVAEADTVVSALDSLRVTANRCDLLLLDINLPDTSGWDILQHLQEAQVRPLPQVIIMTAVRPTAQNMATFAPAGILLKPFPIDTLLRLIEQTLVLPIESAAQVEEWIP